MPFEFPVTPPYGNATYPVVETYDSNDPDPANWQLKIALESPPGSALGVRAVCDGSLASVPPDELAPDWFDLITTPANVPPAAGQTARLYLVPDDAEMTAAVRQALSAAGLGDTVLWFVYENVDANNLDATLINALAAPTHPLATVLLNNNPLTANQRLNAFLEGQAKVQVNRGATLGVAFRNTAADPGRLRFGVMTTTGYVDPIAFYDAMQAHLVDPANLAAFHGLVGTNWPFMVWANTENDAVVLAAAQLYPAPVLYEARVRLNISAANWRAVGDAQKALYWQQLLVRTGQVAIGTTFTFNTDDMVNPFQLEAIVEFFLAWPDPATGGAVPPAAVPNPAQANLLSGTWNLVVIDPFNHAHLGAPSLPRPDYALDSHALTAPGNLCDAANTPAVFNADAYNGVLFLLHNGEIVSWYRWSTYTAHKWEDTGLPNTDCNLASSIQGNIKYSFWSRMSPGNDFINYGFELWDPDMTRNPTQNDTWVPGRFYFRAGTPQDLTPGSIGKTFVMLHYGLTRHSLSPNYAYNGSGGCLVSPDLYKLRNRIIKVYQEDFAAVNNGQRDQNVTNLENLTRADSECRHPANAGNCRKVQGNQWDNRITGTIYVVRPDEPTQK